MSKTREYFLAECAAHARNLSVENSAAFISGLLQSVTEGEDLDSIRRIYNALADCDNQLELIQRGQMKLQLDASSRNKGGHSK